MMSAKARACARPAPPVRIFDSLRGSRLRAAKPRNEGLEAPRFRQTGNLVARHGLVRPESGSGHIGGGSRRVRQTPLGGPGKRSTFCFGGIGTVRARGRAL